MLPLRDLNPTRRFPILTYTLIAANVLVFLWQITLTPNQLQRTFYELSVVPLYVTRDGLSMPTILDIFRSMFFHGGWAHLGGNMLYLFLFGDNVEDLLGKIPFLIIYFGSGFLAALAQVWIEPDAFIPLVGASGAIAGILGSYLFLFPGVRVEGIIPLGVFPIFTAFPAWIVLGFWFITQLFNGTMSLGVETNVGGGVAFFAHVGGFVVGFVLALVFGLVIPNNSRKRREDYAYQRARKQHFERY